MNEAINSEGIDVNTLHPELQAGVVGRVGAGAAHDDPAVHIAGRGEVPVVRQVGQDDVGPARGVQLHLSEMGF